MYMYSVFSSIFKRKVVVRLIRQQKIFFNSMAECSEAIPNGKVTQRISFVTMAQTVTTGTIFK